MELSNPIFGPELKIDFDDITYYKKVGESQNDWEKVPKEIKDTFNKLGIIEAEQKYAEFFCDKQKCRTRQRC